MVIIISLSLATILLALGELVVPGGILGIIAFICLGVATWTTASLYGLFPALAVFFGVGAATVVSLFFFFKVIQKTGLRKSMFLEAQVTGRSPGPNAFAAREALLGKSGEALTALAPTGMVAIDGQSFEAFSQAGFLDKGTACTVIGQDSYRLIVKPL